MDFKEMSLHKLFDVGGVYSVHYFEFSKTYTFTGESHDFWEMVYVDKGEIIETSGDRDVTLNAGEMFLHAPNVWHNTRSNGTIAPNVMVVSFRCKSKAMNALGGKIMRVDSMQRELLSEILVESRRAFSSKFDDPYDNTLERRKPAELGAEQLISIYLAQLLISLYRQTQAPRKTDRKSGSLPMLDAMISYMESNLSKKLTLGMIAEEFHVSQSYVKRLFSQYKQMGAMKLFTTMKIDRAKQLLRERDRNVSQIAEILGYDNSFYFCSQFKKFTGMSPLEYRRSVNAIGNKARLMGD